MVSSLIHSALYSAMETGLNQILSLDPLARKKLEPLSGKLLQVHCELPPLIINLLICEDRILFSGTEHTKPDTAIKGNATALLKLLIKQDTASLKQDGIVISGDVGLLTSMQDILQNIDIDWEYQLSKFVGDIPTQAVSDALNKAGSFTSKARNNLEQDIDTYLHEERNVFPANSDLTDFYQSIDALRLRLDRLASRTNRLETLLSR